jgi:N-acylneuraminate cytidylyltransferase/CMP-N,N'-diacetyllegionaminic acid synthase
MIDGMKVLAIIPARGGSKGLPGKNIRPLCGKPLIAWSITQGLESKYIDRVLVSSDSEAIIDIAKQFGADAPFVRPAELATDESTTYDAIQHVLTYLKCEENEEYDFVVLLEPTSPLRDVSDIDGALELLNNNKFSESLVGVAAAESFHPSFLFTIQNEILSPMLSTQPTGLRRQDINNQFFYLEGSIYISNVEALRRNRRFYHSKTIPWIVSRYKSIEVDELSDFISTEALMKAKLDGLLS